MFPVPLNRESTSRARCWSLHGRQTTRVSSSVYNRTYVRWFTRQSGHLRILLPGPDALRAHLLVGVILDVCLQILSKGIQPIESTPGLSSMSSSNDVRLWIPQAAQIKDLLPMPAKWRRLQRQLARGPDSAQGWIRDDSGTEPPSGEDLQLRLRTHRGHGGVTWSSSPRGQLWTPQNGGQDNHPFFELRAGKKHPPPADRTPPPPGRGRKRARGRGYTSNNAHLTQLSALGGGGNRTRVLGRPTGTSPGAARWLDLSSGLPPAEDPSPSPG